MLSKELILAEIGGSRQILEKWEARIEEGIPVLDLPAPQERLEEFLHGLASELMVCAAKCETISALVLGEE